MIGEVFITERHPDRTSANKAVYRAMGAMARDLHALTPTDSRGRPVPVILDADSEVPYEHVIGAVNALKENRIENIEFAGNPRFSRYYGSLQEGQSDRGRK